MQQRQCAKAPVQSGILRFFVCKGKERLFLA